MHQIYTTVSYEDMRRILDYCRANSVQDGGLFEVYSTPGQDLHMVIVNSCSQSDDGPTRERRPLGAFYCNYLNPGALSIEVEDPYHDSVPSTKRHVEAIRQVMDLLIREGYPGTHIKFNDLPALNLEDVT